MKTQYWGPASLARTLIRKRHHFTVSEWSIRLCRFVRFSSRRPPQFSFRAERHHLPSPNYPLRVGSALRTVGIRLFICRTFPDSAQMKTLGAVSCTMIEIQFRAQDVEALKYEYLKYPHPREDKKMEVLRLKSLELPHNWITFAD